MIRQVGNLFADLPRPTPDEHLDDLVRTPGFRVERIVSHGQASPEDFWYDQETAEWVMVVQGRARLEIEERPVPVELGPGDWVFLPARCRHRVAWTDPDRATVWLAVHES